MFMVKGVIVRVNSVKGEELSNAVKTEPSQAFLARGSERVGGDYEMNSLRLCRVCFPRPGLAPLINDTCHSVSG